jgi:DNA-binding transcriptional ArsR family regulator
MAVTRDVFKAIADPTRREILKMVARQPLNLNSVSDEFDMSRQAVTLHIKLLEECGLLVIRQEGREKYCEARLAPLNEVSHWIEAFRQNFESKLDSMENYLSKIQKTRKNARRKK